MRKYQQCTFATIGTAFGLGLFLSLLCSFKLALLLAAILLIVLGWSIIRC